MTFVYGELRRLASCGSIKRGAMGDTALTKGDHVPGGG